MVAFKNELELGLSDISGQRRSSFRLGEDISTQHTVRQAVGAYLDRMGMPDNGLSFIAFSRGVRLDAQSRIEDLPKEDTQWTVVPEVSAG